MIRTVISLIALSFSGIAAADITNYADVKANGGAQLNAAQLNELLPGAKVVSHTQAGSTRRWENKRDGTLSASTDGRGFAGGRNAYATAEGTWKVTENGRWCVTIKWPAAADDWCLLLFKVGDKYYTVGRTEDTSRTMEFEIAK
jgi:Protein of unknown function (DUF995)